VFARRAPIFGRDSSARYSLPQNGEHLALFSKAGMYRIAMRLIEPLGDRAEIAAVLARTGIRAQMGPART
jgi:hypothetical protein